MPCENCGHEAKNLRTSQQNRSLYLLFSQISKQCEEKGIDLREVVRDEVPIPVTPENIKWMWKLLQKAMFGTRSTAELKKTGEIEVVYDAFNKILIERTNGEVSLPPFPSLESLEKQL